MIETRKIQVEGTSVSCDRCGVVLGQAPEAHAEAVQAAEDDARRNGAWCLNKAIRTPRDKPASPEPIWLCDACGRDVHASVKRDAAAVARKVAS